MKVVVPAPDQIYNGNKVPSTVPVMEFLSSHELRSPVGTSGGPVIGVYGKTRGEFFNEDLRLCGIQSRWDGRRIIASPVDAIISFLGEC